MSVATSYARALFEAAKENQVSSAELNQIEEHLIQIENLIYTSKDAKVALLSPLTSTREKTAIIEEISQKFGFSPLVTRFVVLLAKKGRLSLISEVNEAFSAARLVSEGGVQGTLVSAEPLAEADMNTLTKAFSQKLGKKVAFRVAFDPSLLAGMKVTVNGVTYDGTLRSQIYKLRDHLAAGLPRAHA
jgi:F-type H+-transporting ATPase subunit delta